MSFIDEVAQLLPGRTSRSTPTSTRRPTTRSPAARRRDRWPSGYGGTAGRGVPAGAGRGGRPARSLPRCANGSRPVRPARARDTSTSRSHATSPGAASTTTWATPLPGGGQRRHRAPDESASACWSRTSAIPVITPSTAARRTCWSSGGPGRAHDLPGQHPAVPDGRGAGRPGADGRVGHGWGAGWPRSSTTSGRGSTRTWPSGVEVASAPLNPVRQNAAILLHDRGATPRTSSRTSNGGRWSVPSEPAQQIRVPHRSAVARLHLDLRRGLSPAVGPGSTTGPAGQSVADRFLRLLDEPLTPRAVAGELTAV